MENLNNILIYIKLGQPSCSLCLAKLLDHLPIGILILLFAREVVDLDRFFSDSIDCRIDSSVFVFVVELEELVGAPKVFTGGISFSRVAPIAILYVFGSLWLIIIKRSG